MEKKEAILAKKEEFAEFREELKDMNLSEAKEAIKDIREDLKEWAEDNDLEYRPPAPEIKVVDISLKMA